MKMPYIDYNGETETDKNWMGEAWCMAWVLIIFITIAGLLLWYIHHETVRKNTAKYMIDQMIVSLSKDVDK